MVLLSYFYDMIIVVKYRFVNIFIKNNVMKRRRN